MSKLQTSYRPVTLCKTFFLKHVLLLYPQFFLELITTQLRFYMVSPQLSLLIILTMQSYKFYLCITVVYCFLKNISTCCDETHIVIYICISKTRDLKHTNVTNYQGFNLLFKMKFILYNNMNVWKRPLSYPDDHY